MTEAQKLIPNPDISSDDTAKEQIIALHALLKLSLSERDVLLAKQTAAIAEYFTPGSEEMEWAEQYVENDNWDDE